MDALRTLTRIMTITAALTAAGCPRDDGPTDTADGLPVGPAGGTLSFLDGAVVLDVPAGAVAAETVITVTPGAGGATLEPQPLAGAFYEFGPDGTQFAVPVHLTLAYDPAAVEAGVDPTTMTLGKATADGWTTFPSAVDDGAHTVSADISSFSDYGVVPGMFPPTIGGLPGMAMRFYEWGSLTLASLAADPAGSVFVAAVVQFSEGALPTGLFVAKLNADLSVQWLRTVPSGQGQPYLRADQQGNVYVTYGLNNGTGLTDIGITSFNGAGDVRSGFPTSFDWSAFDLPNGMAVDVQQNVYVLGRTANQGEAPFAVIRGTDGTVATGPRTLPIPMGPGTQFAGPWDLGLDALGNLYVTSYWTSSTVFEENITSFDPSLQVRDGFPLAFPGAFAVARGVNSLSGTPIDLVPVTGRDAVTAFVAQSGDVAAGWPAPVTGNGGWMYATVDLSANVYLLSPNVDGNRIFLGSLNESGDVRSTFPRTIGQSADTDEYPVDFVLDPAGTMYVLGVQTQVATGEERMFILRQPVL